MQNKHRNAIRLSLLFAIAGLALGFLYMRRFEAERSGGESVRVLSVLSDLPPGATLKDSMLGVREIPLAYLDERAILERDKDKVIGIDTVLALRNQQTIQWTDLAVRADVRNLSSLVSPGKRAVTIRASSAEKAGNKLLRPGDYVDLIYTVRTDRGGRASIVLLQKVLVIAVGMRTDRLGEAGDGEGAYVRDDTALTVSLDVEEAQLLALASERGTLSIAVRNPEDARTQEDVPDINDESMIQARDTLRARRRTSPNAELPIRLAN